MRFSIYIATLPNGKQYVGKTYNFPRRIGQHYTSSRGLSKYAFHAAIRKYKIAKFEEFFVAFNETDAFSIECQLIKDFNTLTPAGYNMTFGGANGRTGYTHSQSTKSKISRALTGTVFSEERKHKISISRIGKYLGKANSMYGKPRPIGAGSPKVPVLCITTGLVFSSVNAAAISVNKAPNNLFSHLSGRRKSFAGLIWKRVANGK